MTTPGSSFSPTYPSWRDRLVGGVAAALAGAGALGALALFVGLVSTGPDRSSYGDDAEALVELVIVAALPSAAVVFTVGLVVSLLLDRLLASRSLALVLASYAAVGMLLGGAIAWIVGGPWDTTLLVVAACGVAAAVGCVVSHRRPSGAGLLGWSALALLVLVTLPLVRRVWPGA